ncbi:hypothetical protein [Eisenibacter elegans]|jgi:hypothetical protein|uniref:hypothetical protein n=1 Tax=Eisenibacter elegans TaxID=997 RepID=UPI0003FB1483|nr:hypothetical protein [Eisenibacter elegans]
MEQLQLAAHWIDNHFVAEETGMPIACRSIQSIDELRDSLRAIILKLMHTDFDRLLQAAYRIDIEECAFVNALAAQDADLITELVIERTLQKVKYRQQYRSQA